jgi:hypothetical protein
VPSGGGNSPGTVSDLKASTRGVWTRDRVQVAYQRPGVRVHLVEVNDGHHTNCKAWHAGQQEELSPWGGRECETDDVPQVILLNRGEGQHLGDPGPSRR